MPKTCFLSTTEILAGYRNKTLTPSKVMASYKAQYEAINDKVNAFSFTFFDDAIESAKLADLAYNNDEYQALTGIAVAIKDETYIEGQITTNGSLLLSDFVATSTDPVARRLIDNQAIIHGRTCTPEFSVASTTWTKLWGVSRNPWNTDITCGGSSGGSAIAVATGMCSFANGTDIGGSIRIPAAFCGLYGFKPAHGRVPEIIPYNIDPYCHHGLLTRTVDDLIYGYNLIKGADWEDSHSFVPDSQAVTKPLSELKVAVSKNLGFYQVEQDVLDALDNTVNQLKQAGVQVEYVDLDWDERVIETAKIHQRQNMGLLLRRSWAKPENKTLMNSYTNWYLDKVEELTPNDILDANLYLCKMWEEISPIFKQYDLLLCPTLATTNIPADYDYSKDKVEINGKQVDPNKGWFMTYPFNTLGQCPVLAMPNGFCDNGVPSSVQLVGRPYQDEAIFTLAKYLSETIASEFYTTRFPNL
ncbi:amidase [Psychrosphaera aquimarina]|uniref:Amidase n=1 Tax=Psychrosphaera aquimarina TaxID=2044854 RepID=A0ABU3R0L6_9GAMM|nr:amidase [Psychrosphaera aquimarina]MDU0113229.1 amidase [Psychrosphaera aquimarina]